RLEPFADRCDIPIAQAEISRSRGEVPPDVSLSAFIRVQIEAFPQTLARPPHFIHHVTDRQSRGVRKAGVRLIEARPIHSLGVRLRFGAVYIKVAVVSAPEDRRDLFPVRKVSISVGLEC